MLREKSNKIKAHYKHDGFYKDRIAISKKRLMVLGWNFKDMWRGMLKRNEENPQPLFLSL